MGVYLSSPVTEKESLNEECPNQGFCYGASSMQGWRITQEDAHNCIPEFDGETKTSLFAVYDGHGGSEVAKYCELHFPDFVKDFMETTGGLDTDPTKFIQSAFLAFDATLTSEGVIKELKALSGKEDDLEEDEEEDPVYRSETDLLNEEATMPLEQVLAQYNSAAGNSASKDEGEASSSSAGCSSSATENGPVSSVDKTCPSSSLQSSPPSSSSTATAAAASSSLPPASSSSAPVNNMEDTQSQEAALAQENGVPVTAEVSTNNNCESSGVASLSSTSGEADVTSSGKVKGTGKGKKASAVPTESSAGSSSKPASEPSGSGSTSASGERSSKVKAAADMAKADPGSDSDNDDDEDEEEEDEDMWEDTSDDDEDDDDEEDAEADEDENVPVMDHSDEEPGADSGCTACVLLKQGKKLLVANAGDSRCVLARAGRAVELSFDHKPEDDPERIRIEHAGGKVTADGRVNGGLNLSRAIGDHVYKRNTEVSAREQMITALPDVQIEELCDQDQFIVIACDGIWNYMSSQEVVDYVLGKLRDPEKRKQPAVICEEMFDHCLAPNTFGDGTGCDNMTCIIMVLDTYYDSGGANAAEADEASADHRVSVCQDDKAILLGKTLFSESSGVKQQPTSATDSSGAEVNNAAADSVESVGQEDKSSVTLKRCADENDSSVDLPEKKRLKVEDNAPLV